jgi:hypothetical protein
MCVEPARAGTAFDDVQDQECCQPELAQGEAQAEQAQQRQRLSGHCHSGMARGALFLGAKFGALLRYLYERGLRVTLVGHSLGAGERWPPAAWTGRAQAEQTTVF